MPSAKKHIITNACPEDYENIHKLFISTKTQYFGRHRRKDSVDDLFFKNYVTHRILIPITVAKYIIIGYAEVSNAPNMPALTDDLWLDFINFHYCCNLPLNATNTCFLNKFVYHKDYNPEMLKQLLDEIFYRENNLKYIIVLESPDYTLYLGKDVRNYYCLETFSTVFYPKCFSAITCPNSPKLHVIMRENILPQIRYRKALPEDNDDIVDIVNQDNPQLKEQLGEYYIAEELLSNAESLLIITEINHLTAGFIWLNDNINLLPLLEKYNLQSFGNLLKFNPKERFKEKVLFVNSAHRRPLEKCFAMEVENKNLLCAGEVGNVSNCSLYHYRIETDEETDKILTPREPILMYLDELKEKYKSSHYYVHMRKRPISLFYNIPDGETNAPWDARSNAFSIQLLGLVDSYDPRQVFHYLATAFAAFPNKDYCLLSISSGKETSPIFFEILKYFIPINLRPSCFVREYLFITHRCAVYGDVSLAAARPKDADDIIKLLKQEFGQSYPLARRARGCRISTIANRISVRSLLPESDSYEESTLHHYDIKSVVEILKKIFKDPCSVYKCFTIRCGDSTRSIDDNKIVGFIIIRPFNLSGFLQKHFHTIKSDEFLKAEIITLKLHTLFHFQADFLFHELARQTNYYYFYYLQATDHYNISNDLVNNMQPLEPRRVKKLWFNYFGYSAEFSRTSSTSSTTHDDHNKLTDTLDLLNDKYAVFKTNLRPTAYFGSTKNIVILGLTDISKAFLRLMIFSWHNLSHSIQSTINCLPQLNITVICSPGVMEADHEHAFRCENCNKKATQTCWVNFKNSDAFIRDVSERMDVRTWIRFVSCKIKSIHSDKHLIVMKSGCEIYYEELLLMCGTEFGIPTKIFHDAERPPNYSHFNNRFDKILFYHKLKVLQNNLPSNLKKSIVVYGCHVRAFEFINFLLEHDIEGSEIHLVMPRSRNILQIGLMLNNSAEDPRIEEILREMVEDLNVHIYEHMNLSGCTLADDKKNLKAVTFKKYISNDEITLECDMFVSFYEVSLPGPLLNIFKSGNLDTDDTFVLVNENYQTSQANIYAMGNFIKHKTEPNHQYRFVNPEEAAEKIINVLGLIENDEIEKKFSKSSYFQAQLPMDYLLVKVTTPKRYLANHLDNEYGFPLVTYNEGEFSRVRLNDRGLVEEILIVTKKKKNYDFLKFFCGRHELLLNNLKSRWYLKDIVSFVDFFQEPWTELLMHDQFEYLRTINRNLIVKVAQEVAQKDMARDDKRKLLYDCCQDMGITAEIEYAFLEFIRNNREDFRTNIALPEDFTARTSKAFQY